MIQYNSFDWVYGPSIKITSPDQFVPLFVAYQSPSTAELIRDPHLKLELPGRVQHPITKEKVHNLLREQLNHPCPKQYSIIFHRRQYISQAMREYAPSSIVNHFFKDFVSREVGCRSVVLPGFLGFMALSTSITTLKCSQYPHTIAARNFGNVSNSLLPLVLTVVKAKYIPYLRARLMLQLPIELPIDSVKILISSADSISGCYGSSFNYSLISNFVAKHGITVDYVSRNQMISYILGRTISKSVESYLEHAITAVTHPELMEPINV